jgi:hypothetical protein
MHQVQFGTEVRSKLTGMAQGVQRWFAKIGGTQNFAKG